MLNLKEAAHYLGLSKSYLRVLIAELKIPFIQPSGPGGKIYFEKVDLQRWMDRNKKGRPF